MVDEALKSYLATQVPRCKGLLELLFSNKPEGLIRKLEETAPGTKDALIAAIGRVKILDPACGSGAFPMGALHRLVDLLQKLDPNNEAWKRDRLAEARRYRQVLVDSGAGKAELEACDDRIADIEKSFDTRFHALDFARKLYLIENCIYGVDIQPVATQIAKLRFFIALMVDQKIDSKAPNLGVRPLPNLETRIVAADTLIPIEKEESNFFTLDLDRLREELAVIRHEHFNARTPAAKRKCRDADEAKRGEIAKALQESHALSKEAARKLAAWDPYDQNTFAPFFDSEWMFGLPVGKVRLEGKAPATLLGNLAFINEAGGKGELTVSAPREIDSGFDVVIGNPPYVRMEEIKHYKDTFRVHYECFTGRADLYVYFYEAGLRLLRSGGVISFITSNKYFRAAYGETLRRLLASTTRILHLIDFGDAPVFTAIAYPSIIIAQKLAAGTKPADGAAVRALLWEPGPEVERFAEVLAAKSIRLLQSGLLGDAWRITDGAVSTLIERLRATGVTLRTYSSDRIYRGVVTGLNEAFIIDAGTRRRLISEDKRAAEIIKPFLRGRDLKRWSSEPNEQWLIYTRKGVDMSRYPSVAAYMRPFKNALEGRATKQEWYELQQPQYAYSSAFEAPKIVYPDIYEHQSFALDLTGSYLANTCYFLPMAETWLCGVLNSSVVEWFYAHISNSVRGGYLRAFTDYVRQIPIPNADKKQREAIGVLVDTLTSLTRAFAANPTAQTTRDPLMVAYWERVLNGLVYELYFPEELHAAGLHFFDLVAQAKLPDLATIPEDQRLPRQRKLFETLHSEAHPLRIALDKLQTLETVRIIEGKA